VIKSFLVAFLLWFFVMGWVGKGLDGWVDKGWDHN